MAATHGSPWSYDTFVPIVFAGPGIRPQVVHRPVAPTAVASTLAAYLGFKPPSGLDTGTQVSRLYEGPFPFVGELDRVTITLRD